MSTAYQAIILAACAVGAVFALAWLGLWLVDKLGGETPFEEDDDGYWN